MRYLDGWIDSLSKEKLLLLSGPRQVGKTTLAKRWLEPQKGAYLNWDVPVDRQRILAPRFPEGIETAALVLDEIHKHPRWKALLKGLWDGYGRSMRVVVTGSARLDYYQRGGDSLFGRFEALRLHPFSIAEISGHHATSAPSDWLSVAGKGSQEQWKRLEAMSGFPEPFTRQDSAFYKRWSTRRRSLLLTQDLKDLSAIQLVALVEQLYLLLPERVGSPLSINSLREELAVAHPTVSGWLEALERLYLVYRIAPWSRKISRAIRKERKLYFWDWRAVDRTEARFENMVASHLLKAVHFWNDIGAGDFSLCYVRNKEQQEIDFLISDSRKPIVLIECKLGETRFDLPRRLTEQFGDMPAIQLVGDEEIDRMRGNTRVVSAWRFLSGLV